jgi:CRP/FNR family transcriptional regulator
LPLNREEFGNLVDASRESVSRTLSDFQEDGIIKIDKKTIKILKKEKLEMISKNG